MNEWTMKRGIWENDCYKKWDWEKWKIGIDGIAGEMLKYGCGWLLKWLCVKWFNVGVLLLFYTKRKIERVNAKTAGKLVC